MFPVQLLWDFLGKKRLRYGYPAYPAGAWLKQRSDWQGYCCCRVNMYINMHTHVIGNLLYTIYVLFEVEVFVYPSIYLSIYL